MQHLYLRAILSFFLLFIGLAYKLSAVAAPGNVSVTPVPAWVQQLSQRTQTAIKPSEVNDGYHYLQRSIQWEIAQKAVYYLSTYKITSEEGVQSNSELKMSFDPNHEKLEFHKVVVWRNGSPINKLDLRKVKVIQREQGLEQRIYDESLTAVLFLEDIRVGDIIEYACTVKGSNPVFKGKFFSSFNLQFYDPVDDCLYILYRLRSVK